MHTQSESHFFFLICNYILYESIYNKELVLLKKKKNVDLMCNTLSMNATIQTCNT